MLLIGSLISCWHFSQPYRGMPCKNRILVFLWLLATLHCKQKHYLCLISASTGIIFTECMSTAEKDSHSLRLLIESTLALFQGHSLYSRSLKHIEVSCVLSITFQNTVLTAQKVLMVDESQSLTQWTPHNKHPNKINLYLLCVASCALASS